MLWNNSFLNFNRSCVTNCTPTTCTPMVTVTCSNCCASVCSQVTYTVTITNTSNNTIDCAALHVKVPKAFCFQRGSVTVNGTAQENVNPSCVSLGTIAPGATITVTYIVTIMECKRYNKTIAYLTGVVCCCLENKKVCVPSNINCLQVCCCCPSGTTQSGTTTGEQTTGTQTS